MESTGKKIPSLIPKKINFPPAVLERAVKKHGKEKASLREVGAHTFVGLVVRLVDLWEKGKVDLK